MNTTSTPANWGCTARFFVIFVIILAIIGSIFSAFKTGFLLFTGLAVIIPAIILCIAFLQIAFIHDWFINHFIPFLNTLDDYTEPSGKESRVIRQRVWKRREIVLALVICLFVIKDCTPILSYITPTPNPQHSNGIYAKSMQVDEGKNNQHIMSNIKIGIIDNKNAGPFNQYDATNNGAEQDLESRIFGENQGCNRLSYVTLVVLTSLSQTVADTYLSSNVGLDNLRGAYMIQHNFNSAPSQSFCLHLLIANFGTKGVASQTVPLLMQQISQYAESDPQHFMGIAGLPFSVSVVPALYTRASLPENDLPIISSSASADSFVRANDTPPANFYTNFYRVVPPVSVQSKVMTDFLEHYLAQTQTQTLLFEDPHETYSQSLGDAIYQNLSEVTEVDYTEGQPDSLNKGIAYIEDYLNDHPCDSTQQQPCNPIQIFFSGFADDVNTLKNKLNAEREKGVLIPIGLRIIGGEALYDLGTYNFGNYGNLFFTINSSYTRINQASHSDINAIPIPSEFQHPSEKPPYNEAFNWEFRSFFQQVYPTSIYGSELAGTHVLLMYDAIQSFLTALSHANGETDPYLWQRINKHWLDVKFQGVSGRIQFPQYQPGNVNNPINKPEYIACTNSQGYTHVAGEYDINGDQLQPNISNDELNACLNS